MALFRGINVVSIPVADLDRGREFYRDVLGLGTPVYDLPEAGWIEFATGGAGNLAITAAPQGWAPVEGITVVLDTADCDAACAALRARLARAQLARVPLAVVHHEAVHPLHVRLLRAQAEVLQARGLPDLVQELRLGHYYGVRGDRMSSGAR